MPHNTSGSSSLDRFARRIKNVEDEVRALATTPQLPYSSVEGGSLDFNSPTGDPRVQVGALPDGTNGTLIMNGPAPSPVAGYSVGQCVDGLVASWDGSWDSPLGVAPLDFASTEVHISDVGPEFAPDLVGAESATLHGVFPTARGGVLAITGLATGTDYWVKFVPRTTSGKWGAPTAAVGPIQPGVITQGDIAIDPPPSSPAIISVTGMTNALVVATQPIRPEDLLEYHISTDEGFVPVAGDPDTLVVGASKSTVTVLSSLPDGSPLDPATVYAVSVIAVNSAGSAAPSAPMVGQIDPSAVEALVAQQLVSGFVLAGQIKVGSITIDPDGGIVIPQPDGGVIRFPTSGTDFAEITAHIVAKSLTVEGNMTISGQANLSGAMQLSNGITAPKSAPTMSNFWPATTTGLDYSLGDIYFGMSNRQLSTGEGGPAGVVSADSVVVAGAFYGPNIYVINKSTGVVTTGYNLSSWSGFNPVGGITLIGDYYYAFGYDLNRDSKWYVYVLDRDFVKVGEMYYMLYTTQSGRPTIGRTDDGKLVTAAVMAGTKNLEVKVWTLGTPGTWTNDASYTATGSNNPSGAPAAQNLVGIDFGKQDRGSGATPAFFVAVQGMKKALGYTGSGSTLTRASGIDFDLAGGSPKAMLWDRSDPLAGAGRFLSLDNSGKVVRYSALLNPTYSAQSTFVDLDAGGTGTHETAPSPLRTFNLRRRAWLRVQAVPAPDAGNTDPLQLDKANQVGIYVSSSGTPQLQAVPAIGTSTIELDSLSVGATPPAIPTGFSGAGVTPGEVHSVATDGFGDPLIELSGSGSWRLGDLQGNIFGVSSHKSDVGWTAVTNLLSGSWQVQYRVKLGMVHIVADGNYSTNSGTDYSIVGAGVLPTAIRPPVQLRTGAYFAGHPGTASVATDGSIHVIHQSGAARGTVAFSITYPLP